MAGMRDNLTHAYFGVDYYLVWQTIISDIPALINDISNLLKELKED